MKSVTFLENYRANGELRSVLKLIYYDDSS